MAIILVFQAHKHNVLLFFNFEVKKQIRSFVIFEKLFLLIRMIARLNIVYVIQIFFVQHIFDINHIQTSNIFIFFIYFAFCVLDGHIIATEM